jgi:cation-transporting ATPase E
VSEEDFLTSTRLLGFIRLEDEIRPTAHKIIQYFYDNDIAVKIISGDDVVAVKEIAEKVGVKDLRAIDLSSLSHKNYAKLVQDYAIFTRVTPSEKKELIKAFKKQGSTVAMTGDGVNDILAMKEADVSLAIGEGSDAARRASKFVLLDSGFEAVPSIIDEGRQSINNLERSTSLFLAKTVYASLLAVLFTFLPLNYPYIPIQMTLLNFVCIGAPGVILALEHNTERIKNKFVSNIKHYSVPTGIIIAIAMIILSIVATVNHFDKPLLTTLSAIITFAIYTVLIYQISKPLNLFRAAIIIFVIIVMVGALLLPLTRSIFEFI